MAPLKSSILKLLFGKFLDHLPWVYQVTDEPAFVIFRPQKPGPEFPKNGKSELCP
jgi:hypothetical protein